MAVTSVSHGSAKPRLDDKCGGGLTCRDVLRLVPGRFWPRDDDDFSGEGDFGRDVR